MLKYTIFRYIYPPRPDLYHESMLPMLERNKDNVAQKKLNGTRTEVVIHPNGKIEIWDRHKSLQKAYKLSPEMKESLLALKKGKGFYIFDGELLNNKVKGIKDILVLYDILVEDSQYQFEVSYEKRYEKLKKLFNIKKKKADLYGFKFTPNLYLIENYKKDFQKIFEKFKNKFDVIEGLVIKNIKRPLDYHYFTDKCDWCGKVRYPKKGIYHF